MNNLKQTFFTICLVLLVAIGYSYGMAKTQNEKETGTPRITIAKAQHAGPDRSDAILASIDGHVLSIVFLENLGQVSIEVSNLNGAVVETTNTPTPHGVDMYIPNTGSYIVTFTLSNGDEYYGEFEVTD